VTSRSLLYTCIHIWIVWDCMFSLFFLWAVKSIGFHLAKMPIFDVAAFDYAKGKENGKRPYRSLAYSKGAETAEPGK
jgi:hypothetical protein